MNPLHKRLLLSAICTAALLMSACAKESTTAPLPPQESIASETFSASEVSTKALPQAEEPLVLAFTDHLSAVPAQYLYNPEGQLIRKIHESLETTTEYEYHSNGVLQKESEYASGVLTRTAEYDEAGNPTKEVTYDASGNELAVTQYVNTYDAEGRMLNCVWEESDGMRFEVTYDYREDGTWIDYKDYDISTEEPYLHCHNVLFQSTDGTREFCEQLLIDGSEQHRMVSKTRDEHGNLVYTSDETSVYDYISWETCEFKNVYDADNRLLQAEKYRSFYQATGDNINWDTPMELWSTTDYTYDSSGNLIRTFTDYTMYEDSRETVWEYDAHGNLVYFSGEKELTKNFVLRGEDPYLTEERYTYLPLSEALAEEFKH